MRLEIPPRLGDVAVKLVVDDRPRHQGHVEVAQLHQRGHLFLRLVEGVERLPQQRDQPCRERPLALNHDGLMSVE